MLSRGEEDDFACPRRCALVTPLDAKCTAY